MTIRHNDDNPGPRGGLGLVATDPYYSAEPNVKEKEEDTAATAGLWTTTSTTSAEEAAATAPPPRRTCISDSFHGRTLRLTANGGRDSVDPDGCFCCCPMPPPCLICCCAAHVQGTGGTGAVRVRYDAPSGILTRVDGWSGACGLILNQDWGEVSPGTGISSFRCGLTPCCTHDDAQFDVMSDGTIVPRKDHTVCVGFEGGKTVLVPVGHAGACIFDDVLRGAAASAAPAHAAMSRGAVDAG